MKIKKEATRDSTGGPINALNYAKRCEEYMGSRQTNFVIRNPDGGSSTYWADSPPTPAQWNAWMLWFAEREIPTVFAAKHGVVTVSCEWPEDFDPSAAPSDKAWRAPSGYFNARSRADAVMDGFADLQTRIGAPPDRRGPNNFQRAADKLVAEQALEAKKEGWRAPLVVSELLLRSLAQKPF